MMFKKMHNRLLEQYPLLWNMRLPGIFGVLLLFHLLHFIIGYTMYTGIEDMGWESPTGVYFSTSFALFSIIGSCVIFILWLNRVFRNNAFKSFYPVSNRQLYSQFLIFFLVSFLNITCYYSFTSGYVFHAKNNTSNSNNEKDIETYNRVAGLLQNKEDYRIENRCSPYPFPLSKKYVSDVAIRSGNESPDDYYYITRDGQAYSSKQVDSIAGGFEYSYLNFCNNYAIVVAGKDIRYASYDNYEQGIKAYGPQKILKDPRQLKADMRAFLALCDRNKVGYHLDADEWFSWVNNPPYYPVRYTIYQKYAGPSRYVQAESKDFTTQAALQLNPKGYYVELQKLRSILQNTQKAYEYNYVLPPLLGLMYAALSIALLIFTFRATSRRIWMITIIGSALLCLVIGAFTAVLAFGGGKEGILFFYLFIICAFLVLHLLSPNKTISGVSLNWFAWSLPIVSTIILGLMESKSSTTTAMGLVKTEEPWIFRNLDYYFLICLLSYLLIFWVLLIPRYRHWQAMTEN
jgi:hypothetical protein